MNQHKRCGSASFKDLSLYPEWSKIRIKKTIMWNWQNHRFRDLYIFLGAIPIRLFPKENLVQHLSKKVKKGSFWITWPFISFPKRSHKPFFSHDIMPNGLPCYEFYNALLLILQFMHIYWFYFILKLLFKIITGGEELKDNREYADKDK